MENNYKHLVRSYISVWNEKREEKQREILKEIWKEEGEYIDPRSNLKGIEELLEHIKKIQQSRPGTKIIQTSELDIHHEVGRFKWQLIKEDKTILLEGLDIIYYEERGRKIKKILGFFGKLEEKIQK